jgi:Zn finger protein HypA/HybF involved in hydrogenase expression
MKKLTKEEFIERSNKIHKNCYDYSLVEYENVMKKVIIICHKHGKFEQTPLNHLNGHICKKCSREIVAVKQRKDIEFIEKSNIKYNNKYDYSLVEFINRTTKVRIICPIHGEFLSTPTNHLNRNGCSKCSKYELRKDNKLKFIEKSNFIHNGIYDYSHVEYISDKVKVKIVCSKHGEFEQQPNTHLNGVGCPTCKSSKGEIRIQNYFMKNNIYFIKEHRFNECFYKKSLSFDFYLPNHNICIEFDGKQHFRPINFFGGYENFKNTIVRDTIKNKFCLDNNIKIIRIPYDKYKEIEKILQDELWENY